VLFPGHQDLKDTGQNDRTGFGQQQSGMAKLSFCQLSRSRLFITQELASCNKSKKANDQNC
jgi:hypothetical protein